MALYKEGTIRTEQCPEDFILSYQPRRENFLSILRGQPVSLVGGPVMGTIGAVLKKYGMKVTETLGDSRGVVLNGQTMTISQDDTGGNNDSLFEKPPVFFAVRVASILHNDTIQIPDWLYGGEWSGNAYVNEKGVVTRKYLVPICISFYTQIDDSYECQKRGEWRVKFTPVSVEITQTGEVFENGNLKTSRDEIGTITFP